MSDTTKANEVNADTESKATESKATESKATESKAIETINLIMRQTDYDAETALQKLIKCNNDVIQVIRDYMNPLGKESTVLPPARLSTNQQIYKEIRTMMDDAAFNYELTKALNNASNNAHK